MKKIASVLILLMLFLGCTDSSEDPYLNLDPELRIETRSLIVPASYALLADENRSWGAPFFMSNIEFKEGGNVAEIQVQFNGGCALHRFALYADSTYEDLASFDQALDIKLYLYHSHGQEDCSAHQDHVLRRMDLSFLHPGRYNITIQNSYDRTQFRVLDYEVR